MRGLGLLVLRCIVGVGFVAHGLPKLIPVWGGGPRETAVLLEKAGVSWTFLVTIGTGLVETLSGVLLLAGAFVVWASLVLAATTAATALVLYLPHGFFLNWSLDSAVPHGYEFHLLRFGALVCLMLAGPGGLSYDLGRQSKKETKNKKKTKKKMGQ